MATRRRPPVIPEIARAYQNDPRTLLARQALATGASVAPVAAGKYAWADGIARALSGVAGGYINREREGFYGAEEAAQIAKREKRGADGLTGLQGAPVAAPAPAPATPVPQTMESPPEGMSAVLDPRVASSIATATGAPPPAPPQPPGPIMSGPASIPMAPIPPPNASPVAPVASSAGVAPANTPPFGAARAGSSAPETIADWDAAPTIEELPDAPAPVARPNAPSPVAAKKSRLLEAAYRIMLDADPYESAMGQEMYARGLAEQTELDEAAAEREQRMLEQKFDNEWRMFADAESQDRGAAIQDRRDVRQNNFESVSQWRERRFRADESGKDRALRQWETRFSAQTQYALEASRQNFQAGQSALDRAVELAKVGGAGYVGSEAALKDANEFFNTSAGSKILTQAQQGIASADEAKAALGEFRKVLRRQQTGGALNYFAPGVVPWSNSNLQYMKSLSNMLALARSQTMKGALSDKDIAFLLETVPNIRNTRQANIAQIAQLERIADLQSQFALQTIRARERGEGSRFLEDWINYADYSRTVSPDRMKKFEAWRASVPTVDANGNPVRR